MSPEPAARSIAKPPADPARPALEQRRNREYLRDHGL